MSNASLTATSLARCTKRTNAGRDRSLRRHDDRRDRWRPDFRFIALVADGLHMSTHTGALLLAALAYTYARKHADDSRFTFGTGKLGDLAGFTSDIILAMIALLIGESGAASLRRCRFPLPK